MSYIGNVPTSTAFLTDQFSGNGTSTTFTMSVSPACSTSVLVSISGVLQDPFSYSVSGTTLSFASAPPTGTGNISVRYLGIPATGVVSTAYRTVTEFTATTGQTTFTPTSYTVGYIAVYRNGVRLGATDYTATSGTSVVLAVGANAGDLIVTESFYVSSVLNAIPSVAGAVNSTYLGNGSVTSAAIDQSTVGPMFGMRNKLINGAMVIDQRNSGAVSANTINGYFLDRWQVLQTTSGKLVAQQNAGSVAPPVGFTNYLGITSQSAYTVGASDLFRISQQIEGYNFADMGWGTSWAKPVTLSFWVYSSLTGTFGGAIGNNGGTRTYPFTYSVSVANTWTYITMTIPGDTTGTYASGNASCIYLQFLLGGGSSTTGGTVNTWGTSAVGGPTGCVSIVGTSGATFYLTGVQLEKGSTATPFDYRPHGTELALCQRYCFVWSSANGSGDRIIGFADSTTNSYAPILYPVKPRSRATGIIVSSAAHYSVGNPSASGTATAITFIVSGEYAVLIAATTTAGSPTLANGTLSQFFPNTTSAKIEFTGMEL